YDLRRVGLFITQDALHAHDDMREPGQLHLAAGELRGERLHESEGDIAIGAVLSRVIAWRGGGGSGVHGGSRRSVAESDAERLAQGLDLVLGLVDQLLVAR